MDRPAPVGQGLQGIAVHIAAGGVGGAIGTVAAHREDGGAARPRQRRGGGQRQFLVASAQPPPDQVYDGLAARQKGQRLPAACVGAGHRPQEPAGFPGFAVQPVGEQHRLIAQLPAGRGRRGAELPHTAGDAGLHAGQLFGGLLTQTGGGLGAQPQAVLLRNGQRLGAGGGIGTGRAGGDHVQRVARNVAEHDAEHLRRRTGQRKAAALDIRQPLADGVHLDDVRPAAQQLGGDVLQFRPGDPRLFEQGAAPAGKQEEHRVSLAGAPGQRKSPGSGREAVFVGDRVTGLIAGHAGQLAPYMAVLGDDDALVHPAQTVEGGPGHLPGGLACRHQQDAPAGRGQVLQGPPDRRVRLDRLQAGCQDLLCIGAQGMGFGSHGKHFLSAVRSWGCCGGSKPSRRHAALVHCLVLL